MEIGLFDVIKLKNGQEASVVDRCGPDYIVDVGDNPSNFDTIMVSKEEVECIIKKSDYVVSGKYFTSVFFPLVLIYC